MAGESADGSKSSGEECLGTDGRAFAEAWASGGRFCSFRKVSDGKRNSLMEQRCASNGTDMVRIVGSVPHPAAPHHNKTRHSTTQNNELPQTDTSTSPPFHNTSHHITSQHNSTHHRRNRLQCNGTPHATPHTKSLTPCQSPSESSRWFVHNSTRHSIYRLDLAVFESLPYPCTQTTRFHMANRA